jgi:hypothetical protein
VQEADDEEAERSRREARVREEVEAVLAAVEQGGIRRCHVRWEGCHHPPSCSEWAPYDVGGWLAKDVIQT